MFFVRHVVTLIACLAFTVFLIRGAVCGLTTGVYHNWKYGSYADRRKNPTAFWIGVVASVLGALPLLAMILLTALDRRFLIHQVPSGSGLDTTVRSHPPMSSQETSVVAIVVMLLMCYLIVFGVMIKTRSSRATDISAKLPPNSKLRWVIAGTAWFAVFMILALMFVLLSSDKQSSATRPASLSSGLPPPYNPTRRALENDFPRIPDGALTDEAARRYMIIKERSLRQQAGGPESATHPSR